jgi:prephenate dehydrogenase (NADP+)
MNYIFQHQRSHSLLGLAIMNPSARIQITQYAKSVADLFKLMIQEKEEEFRARIRRVSGLNFPLTCILELALT